MATSRRALVGVLVAALFSPAIALAAPDPPASKPGAAKGPPKPPVLVPPRLLTDADVPYPPGAKGDAAVLLLVTLEADGSVRAAKPLEGDEPFASAAVEVALKFRFAPATRDGAPVAATVRFELRFKAPAPVEPAADEGDAADTTNGPGAGAASRAGSSAGSGAGTTPPDVATTGAARPAARKGPPAEAVTIRGQRAEASRTVSLTRAEVRQIPGTFGDPFRAVEMMPGVTPIVSGLPFFYVRGAPPGNTGYYLDGIRVPLLFHVGAGPSVVHPGIVDRVDLYPGGYPARYGRFAGGIVAGETMPPRPEWHGEGNLRLFDVGALVEGPFDGGRGVALVAGRYSYTAALLSLLAPNVSLSYWDYQARLSYAVTPDDRLTVFSFGAYDYLGQTDQGVTTSVFGTEFHRVDVRHDRSLGSRGHVRTAVMLGVDRTRFGEDRFVRDRLVGVRNELTYALSPGALLRAGVDANLDTYDIEFGATQNPQDTAALAEIFPTRRDVAMGARADVVLRVTPRLEVTPGLRVDFYGSQGATGVAIDPRVASKVFVSDRVRLLEAAGLVHQTPAFVIPVPGFQPGGLRGGLQKALQHSAGVEVDVDAATVATGTLFHNGFFNMSDALGTTQRAASGCPPGAFPEATLPGDPGGAPGQRCVNDRFVEGRIGTDGGGGRGGQGPGSRSRTLEVRALGASYGLELMVKRKLTRRVGGFAAYTLSRSVRSVGNRSFVASFDRTHVANAALAFDLGRAWRAGVRLMYYTGVPSSVNTGTDVVPDRLPSFYRVDLRLEKRWSFSRDAWVSFVAEWLNATLNKEAVSTTCTLQGCEARTIGPVSIPSLGLEGGF